MDENVRRPAFNNEENTRLIRLVQKYTALVDNPGIDRADKRLAWKAITVEFNKGIPIPEMRDTYQLQLRYKNFKRNPSRLRALKESLTYEAPLSTLSTSQNYQQTRTIDSVVEIEDKIIDIETSAGPEMTTLPVSKMTQNKIRCKSNVEPFFLKKNEGIGLANSASTLSSTSMQQILTVPTFRKIELESLSLQEIDSNEIEQRMDLEFENMLKDDKVSNLIRKIAAERVRINDLLSINGMANIRLPLYAKPEILELQLMKRFNRKKNC